MVQECCCCYVSLDDLQPDVSAADELARCRWITRGWTLQELIAPETVAFYDMAWNYRGSKLDFIDAISKVSRIPLTVLRSHQALQDCSVAMKMAWAANRQTTRLEDTAYSLLGIFDVNMSLLYGEGRKAFRRLQEEVVKSTNDLTIFAWDVRRSQEVAALSVFATSPDSFAASYDITPFSDDFANFYVTNKGLLVSGDMPLRAAVVKDEYCDEKVLRYLLCLGTALGEDGGIYLRKIGPNLFFRDGDFSLAGFSRHEIDELDWFDAPDYYILIDPTPVNLRSSFQFRDMAIHVPTDPIFVLEETVPQNLWDLADRIFLRPKPYHFSHYPMVIAMAFRATLAGRTLVSLVVLCDYSMEIPLCKIFRRDLYSQQAAMIFNGRHKNDSMLWADLKFHAPELLDSSDYVDMTVPNGIARITASLVEGRVRAPVLGCKMPSVFSLKFYISRA